MKTLDSIIDSMAEHGEAPAILALTSDGIDEWSYDRLADRSAGLAGELRERGLERGGHVALVADNGPEWIAACLALIRAGAVPVPIDAQFADDVMAGVLTDSEAGLVFAGDRHRERIEELDLDPRPEVISLREGDRGDGGGESRQSAGGKGAGRPDHEPDDVAVLFYTSGTTGPPKGVPLTHGNLAFQLKTLRELELVEPDDRLLLPLPLHHVYSFVIGMLTPLALGLPIILPDSLTGPAIVRALREGKATVMVGVPRLYQALYQGLAARAESAGWLAGAAYHAAAAAGAGVRRAGVRPPRAVFGPLHERFGPELRMLASGGAAIEPELARRLEGLGWKVAVGYGLTETSPLLTLTRPGEGALKTVGKPIPGVEIRIDPSAHPAEDESGEAQADGEEGEILARGPGVFGGYRNLPDKTEKSFTEDGWFRTGDLGVIDDDGYLHVTGRVSTLIVMPGGENIQPDQVEAAYAERPEIREVGVLQQEDALVALIVPEPRTLRERDADVEEAIRRAVEERAEELPSYQRVSDYAITREALPRTRLGKIMRGELGERWERARSGEEAEHAGPMDPQEMTGEDRSLLDDEAARSTWEMLAERYPDQRLTPDTSPQMDLGVDSLDWVELTLEIGERTGVELSEDALGRAESVRDLLREVSEGRGEDGEAARIDPLDQPEEVLSERQKRWLRPLGRREAVAARALHRTARGLMRSVYRLSVEGADRLPGPDNGPFILAPNHVSYLDPLALAAALDHELLRRTYWGSFSEAFHRPVLRTLSRLAQAVPVERERGATSSLAFAAAVLDRGDNLIWFPEGTRSNTGELQELKPGIGRLVEHFRVPVVPIHLAGTYKALRPGSVLPRPTRITVSIGEPAEADALERDGSGESAGERILDALHERMQQLARSSV